MRTLKKSLILFFLIFPFILPFPLSAYNYKNIDITNTHIQGRNFLIDSIKNHNTQLSLNKKNARISFDLYCKLNGIYGGGPATFNDVKKTTVHYGRFKAMNAEILKTKDKGWFRYNFILPMKNVKISDNKIKFAFRKDGVLIHFTSWGEHDDGWIKWDPYRKPEIDKPIIRPPLDEPVLRPSPIGDRPELKDPVLRPWPIRPSPIGERPPLDEPYKPIKRPTPIGDRPALDRPVLRPWPKKYESLDIGLIVILSSISITITGIITGIIIGIKD